MDTTYTNNSQRMAARLLIVVALTAIVAAPSFGQDVDVPLQLQEHWEPGRPTMQVYVLGAVGNPGIWRVNRDVTFVEFLTLVSPSGIGVRSIDVLQNQTIELYRTEATGRQLVYTQDLNDVVSGLAPSPTLQHNDLLVFDSFQRPRRRITFRTVTTTIGTASSLLLLYLRLRSAAD